MKTRSVPCWHVTILLIGILSFPASLLWAREDVTKYGASGTGVTDDTTSIQAAANAIPASGGELYFPPGKYKIKTAIALKSGTKVIGEGVGSRIFPVPPGDPLGGYVPTPSPGIPGLPSFTALFTNVNHDAATITDRNITFENVALGPDNPPAFVAGAILMRKVQNLKVLNCFCYNVNSMVQVMAGQDVLIENCWATNTPNAAFDFWEGPVNVTLRNCTSYGSGAGYGISLNAYGTGTAGRNFLVEGCRIYNAPPPWAGIYIAPLGGGSTIQNARVENNHLDNAQIVVKDSDNVQISHNTIENTSACPISFIREPSAGSANAMIGFNQITNCAIPGTGFNSAYIYVDGTKPLVIGNKAVGSSAYYGVILNDAAGVVAFNDLPGYAGEYMHTENGGGPPATAMNRDPVTGVFENNAKAIGQTASIPYGSGTMSFDLTGAAYQMLTVPNNVAINNTFHRAAGRSITVRILNTGGGSLWYSNEAAVYWRWLAGRPPHGTFMPAGKIAVLTLTAYGPDETDVVASMTMQE